MLDQNATFLKIVACRFSNTVTFVDNLRWHNVRAYFYWHLQRLYL